MNPQQFSLRWNNYTSYIAGAFDSLRYEEDFVDVTLCCEGRKIRAHKILLSACSPYFKDVFKENPCQHPVIIFKNVRYTDLMSLVEFMYQGEVSVPQEQLPSFLHTAEILAIRGLTDNTSDSRQPASTTTSAIAQQLIQSQAVLEKPATITTTDSLYLTLPSNSTIVHQPKLVQAQIQTTPIITKPLIKNTPTEMPSLAASSTLAVPIAQQQQPAIAKIQVQASSQSQQPQQVQVQVQQVQQTQTHQTQQATTSQTQSQSQQATTLQEVVENVVLPRKKKVKGQQIIASQSNTSIPSGSTVTVTTTTTGQSGDNEMYETDTYTITTKDAREDHEQAEQYVESGQSSGTTLKMEIPEFISVGEPINTGNGTNNTYLQVTGSLSQHVTIIVFENEFKTHFKQYRYLYSSSYDIFLSSLLQKSTYEAEARENYIIIGSLRSYPATWLLPALMLLTRGHHRVLSIVTDIVSENKWSRCKICRLVITASNLWRHVRTQHSRLEPKRCEHCKKQFKNKYSLREHVRITHESKQPREENIKQHNIDQTTP
ncbi:AGAP001073-PB [Anopheles gambiae str. PEST]|uniref:AGAP001073-PB n=1 Tax=Anopheles gambiae TaxID=7165 RepID=F5HM08_ANOGA|nr:AGAP001073-PB [Anopheles gambiae str. PEST]